MIFKYIQACVDCYYRENMAISWNKSIETFMIVWIYHCTSITSTHHTTRLLKCRNNLKFSHNFSVSRYLKGGQLTGDASVEGYINALACGVRLLECWGYPHLSELSKFDSQWTCGMETVAQSSITDTHWWDQSAWRMHVMQSKCMLSSGVSCLSYFRLRCIVPLSSKWRLVVFWRVI